MVDKQQSVNYSSRTLEVRKTLAFDKWFVRLKDRKAKARIQARIDRLELGHFGDIAAVGDGVSEMRIFHGPGYRVYFTQRSDVLVILLAGGTKHSQQADIAKARKLASQIET